MITEITKSIYWMPFPKSEKIKQYAAYLNKTFGDRYYIWNLSEHDYNREHFNHQVATHQYPGFSSPPIYEQFLICKNILEWIQADNVAIIHCQSNRGRSALLFSLLLALLENRSPNECFIQVSRQLKINSLFPSQHQHLVYLSNIYDQLELNLEPIRLKAIILSNNLMNKQFSPLLQIASKNEILYESKNEVFQAGDSIVFVLDNISINQDIVIKCKAIDGTLLLPVFRIQLHTAFMLTNIQRFYKSDIDLSVDAENEFFIDVIYQKGQNQLQIPIITQQTQDYQTREGIQLIYKLQQHCRQLCGTINKQIFPENTINFLIDPEAREQIELQEMQLSQLEHDEGEFLDNDIII